MKIQKQIKLPNTYMKSISRADYALLLKILRDTREERGLTQAELGMLLGQDQTYVSKYEKAVRRLDIIETIDVCSALKIDIKKLISKITKN